MDAISADVKSMAANGAKIGADAAEITASINSGKGSLGKLVNDDELYVRVTAVAKQADEVITNVRQVVDQAKVAIDGIQSKEGPLQNVAVSVTQTMDEARAAMAGFAENMDALKHNFLVRGYFNKRGYFALADVSPAAYRQGSCQQGRPQAEDLDRIGILFEPRNDAPGEGALSAAGRTRLDAALAPYLGSLQDGVLMVEDTRSTARRKNSMGRSRAAPTRDYLIAKFHLIRRPRASYRWPANRPAARIVRRGTAWPSRSSGTNRRRSKMIDGGRWG